MKFKNRRQHKFNQEEADLQIECNKYLRDHGIKFIHLERGKHEKRKAQLGAIPDLLIFVNSGRTIFVELKSNGNLSKDQRDFMDDVVMLGFNHYVLTNFHQFKIAMDKEGIIEYDPNI